MRTTTKLAPIAALAVAACGGVPGSIEPGKADPAPAPAPAAERPLSDYLHDLSPVIEGVTLENATVEHYSIPTSDGTVLDGWIRRPPGEEKQPTVIVFTPYYGGGDPTFAGNALGDPSAGFGQYLIPRGYAVGFVSVGGTGNSTGCFRNGGPVERKQLADAVGYLAAQPWSNGALAAIGVSYDGTTANELFIEAPPALKTVVPMEAITDYYRYSFNNGIVREDTTFFTTYYYPIVGLSPAGLEGGVGPSDPANWVQQLAGEPCPEQLAIQQQSVTTGITTDKNAFWQERDAIALVRASLDRPRPSMFYIQGFEDANVDPQMAEGFLEAVAETGVPLHVWFGQWVHAYPENSGCAALEPCRGDFFEEALLAWFDQFLKGRDTGILDAPAVQLQADDGVWRHEDAWPPQLDGIELFPAGGTLGAAPATGIAVYRDIGPNQASEGNTSTVVHLPMSGGTLLEFVGEPLTANLRLTGMPRLTAQLVASGPRANLVATLIARKADGTDRFLNFGAINLNHAGSAEAIDTNITGKTLAFTVSFFPQDNVVAAGERLVLVIGGDTATEDDTAGNAANLLNYGPSLLPIGVSADVTLDLTQTKLWLPANPRDRVEPLSW